jgi:hypothetical protein
MIVKLAHMLETFTGAQSFSANTWLDMPFIGIHESVEVDHRRARAIQYHENCGAGFGVHRTYPLVANGAPRAPLLLWTCALDSRYVGAD